MRSAPHMGSRCANVGAQIARDLNLFSVRISTVDMFPGDHLG
jgi:hypothetical protein